jgi:hypothetical protein
LSHFTLVLSEDGAGFEYSSEEGNDEVEDQENEDEYAGGPDDEENAATLVEPSESDASQHDAAHEPEGVWKSRHEGTVDEDLIASRFLDRLDEQAMETMSKGYFRHLGNIHFESAVHHPDHWESWEVYRDELKVSCEQEKGAYPVWIRPKISIMAVEYGLHRPGDFKTKIHLLGDHTDDVLENIGDGHSSEKEDGNDSEFDAGL